MKYLYGASVQGIQSFIFQTNKLKDIAGASELVEEICTTQFARMLYSDETIDYDCAKEKLSLDGRVMLFAAGNIKCIFEDKEECSEIVLRFPELISRFAPGVTVSQAVVGYTDEFNDAIDELESRLKIQRNRRTRSSAIGYMGVLRSRQTGLPVTYRSGKDFLDAGTVAKRMFADTYNKGVDKVMSRQTTLNLCKKSFGYDVAPHQIPFDIKKITGKNDWIAIIHADGNGLGQVVQKVRHPEAFKKFSIGLDRATVRSSVAAAQAVVSSESDTIPIRPIVLGGDDLTVICRADMALDFTERFLVEFETATSELLGDLLKEYNVFTQGKVRDRLTACAGITYMKSSFPFYYGYQLAEELCKEAKSDSKSHVDVVTTLPQSCLMFYKVQNSIGDSYSDLVQRELTPHTDLSFRFGPYYTECCQSRWTTCQLKNMAEKFDSVEGNAAKSNLRKWMSELYRNSESAEQMLDRIKSQSEVKQLIEEVSCTQKRGAVSVSPVYDVLAIHTIGNQETK